METILALLLLLFLLEVRQWRMDQKLKKLFLVLRKQKRSIETLARAHEKSLENLGESLLEVSNFHQGIETKLETILKEYELNGIPLGYERKRHDFIEGI